ncbi:hypothetical protein Pelo_19066 [Pelomyxa schiedti]|nr:hypothetical protein Pelo_19066 [Pelomyxa schiedti]
MNPTATIRAVIDARSQFIGGFACSVLERCGRGSPARLLSHNRALCEQFGRDWVVGCSRWIGTTVTSPLVGGGALVSNGKTTANIHVFIGLSATLGVVSFRCITDSQVTTLMKDEGRLGHVEECVGDDRFVEGSFLGRSCIVNSKGEVLAELEGVTQLCDLFGFWVSNKRWLVRVTGQRVAKVIVWKMNDNGAPASPCGVVLKCTVAVSGGCVARLSPFDPCGDVIVFVIQQPLRLGDQLVSTISFVDLGKSIEAGVTVVVSNKTVMFLPPSTPMDLVWASPSTILLLYREVRRGGGFRVFNTVTGETRSFSAEMYTEISTAWPSHIIAFLYQT